MSTRRWLIWLIVVTACAAILPPVIFGVPRTVVGQTGGDAWRNAIYDFQTLLTGFFAVGAALLTIWQMRTSDARAEDRHRDLVKLGMRAERLRFERLLFPHCERIVSRLQYLDTLPLIPYAGAEAIAAVNVRSHIDAISDTFTQMSDKCWDEARDLFSGALSHKLALFKERAPEAVGLGWKYLEEYRKLNGSADDGRAVQYELAKETDYQLFHAKRALRELMQEIKKVASEYEIAFAL